MSKLAYDICRCMGKDCAARHKCLRHTDRPEDQHARLSFAVRLCNHEAVEAYPNMIADDDAEPDHR